MRWLSRRFSITVHLEENQLSGTKTNKRWVKPFHLLWLLNVFLDMYEISPVSKSSLGTRISKSYNLFHLFGSDTCAA